MLLAKKDAYAGIHSESESSWDKETLCLCCTCPVQALIEIVFALGWLHFTLSSLPASDATTELTFDQTLNKLKEFKFNNLLMPTLSVYLFCCCFYYLFYSHYSSY